MRLSSLLRSGLKVGQAVSGHPVVRIIETAGVLGSAAKFVMDTDVGKKAAEEGKALAVSGYQGARGALGYVGSLFVSGPPAPPVLPAAPPSAPAPAVDVGLTRAEYQKQAPWRNAAAATARAKRQALLNQRRAYAQQQQLAQQSFDPSQYAPLPDPSQGYYDPSQYPTGAPQVDLGQLLALLANQGGGQDQQVDPSMFVQGVFTVAGTPYYLANRAPADVGGVCSVGCAGKAGDADHKPCGPCAAKAAAAALEDVGASGEPEGDAGIEIAGEAAPAWTPNGEGPEVGAWVPGHWVTDQPSGRRRWITGRDNAPSARAWRWVRKAVTRKNGTTRADGRTWDATGKQWVLPGTAGLLGGVPATWDGRVWVATGSPGRRPAGTASPVARGAHAVFDAALSSTDTRIASLRRQLHTADVRLQAALNAQIDTLTAQKATTLAAQAALLGSTSPQAPLLQQQLVTLAQTEPDKVPAMLAALSAQVGNLARGQDVSNQAAQFAAQQAQRAADEVASHEWQAPGTPDDANITPEDINPDVDDGSGSSFGGEALWDELGDVDGVRGVGHAFSDVAAAIDLAGVADDAAAVAAYGGSWDLPSSQDATPGGCTTGCPPRY